MIVTTPLKKNPKTIFRKKNIVIEDVQRAGLFMDQYRASKLLSCRNPFKADEQLINYDLDTEDEMEEENGEDLKDENNLSDDDEEDLEEQELQKGFIVDDDYLSVSELNYSDQGDEDQDQITRDLEQRKLIKKRNRESK